MFCLFQEIIMLIVDILFQIKVLIDGKSFFDLLVKNEEETYEKVIDNNDYR